MSELRKLKSERDTALTVAEEALRLMTDEQLLTLRANLDAREQAHGGLSLVGRADPGGEPADPV
jgi:hypothetical protein